MLLHVCCAPCSPYVVEKLKDEHEVTLYFYNPNIHPEEEYHRRLRELRRWAGKAGVALIVEEYEIDRWFEATKGMFEEPEGGARCEICIELRLARTAGKAAELGFEAFGTVLSVSPHKDAALINCIGEEQAGEQGVEFLPADWKKKDGFKITTQMGRKLGLYRQDYCGCMFSLRDKKAREREKENRPRR